MTTKEAFRQAAKEIGVAAETAEAVLNLGGVPRDMEIPAGEERMVIDAFKDVANGAADWKATDPEGYDHWVAHVVTKIGNN